MTQDLKKTEDAFTLVLYKYSDCIKVFSSQDSPSKIGVTPSDNMTPLIDLDISEKLVVQYIVSIPYPKKCIEREAKLVEALNNTLKFMQQIQDDHKNKGRYYLPPGNTLLHDARYWEEKLQETLKELGIEI